MSESTEAPVMSVLRIWAALAWADDVLAEAEVEGLRRLLRTADLTTAERQLAGMLVAAPVALPDVDLAHLSPEARRGAYRAACRFALVDRHLAPAEQAMLARIRVVLEVPAAIATEIEADVPGFHR